MMVRNQVEHFTKLVDNIISYIELDKVNIKIYLSLKIPISLFQKYKCIIINESHTVVEIGFVKDNIDFSDTILNSYFTKKIKPYLITINDFNRYFKIIQLHKDLEYLLSKIKHDISSYKHTSIDDSSNILKLTENILSYAIDERASDIHIEAGNDSYKIRFRVDGKLELKYEFDKDISLALISKIKLLAHLDIAKSMKSQDGRFTYLLNSMEYDFRVSTILSLFGESIVLRILDKSLELLNIKKLGFTKKQIKDIYNTTNIDNGLILITGPTGSGKTTTLYSILNEIKNINKKIITIEDPIEYQLDLIQQLAVNHSIGMEFDNILKSILRHDPDIMMIGEIRDNSSLSIAVQSALTGHLVLSTLHTNDALSTLARLYDMGAKEYLVKSTLKMIISQKLERVLCKHCKIEYNISDELKVQNSIESYYKLYKPVGCSKCNYSGYLGRVVLSELLLLKKFDFKTQQMPKDFKTLKDDALQKCKDGELYIHDIL